MNKTGRYSSEFRERAVQLVFEHGDEDGFAWGAFYTWGPIELVADKIGCPAETLREWVRQEESAVHLEKLSELEHQENTKDNREYIKCLLRGLYHRHLYYNDLTDVEEKILDKLTSAGGLASIVLAYESSESIREVRTIVESLKHDCKDSLDSENEDVSDSWTTTLEYMDSIVNTASFAWAPRIKRVVKIKDLDRDGEMFGGWPWTSASYPWPRYNDCGKDKPYAPALQIDLGIASKLYGVDFGNALLQLWCSGSLMYHENILRIIPRDVILSEKVSEEYQGNYGIFGCYAGEHADGPPGLQIVDWMPAGLQLDVDSINEVKDRLAEQCDKNIDALAEKLLEIGDDSISFGSHLFGTAQLCDEYYYDRFIKQGWNQLIAIGGDTGFFGGVTGGNIFFRKKDDNAYEFQFYVDNGW